MPDVLGKMAEMPEVAPAHSLVLGGANKHE